MKWVAAMARLDTRKANHIQILFNGQGAPGSQTGDKSKCKKRSKCQDAASKLQAILVKIVPKSPN
jgi:hypothetical protein